MTGAPDDFAGLVGLVTGGGAGIGAAITSELRTRGATVAVLDVRVPRAGDHVR